MSFNLYKLPGLPRTFLMTLGVVASCSALTGCDMTRNQLKTDRAAHMEFQDYRDAMATRLPLHDQQARDDMSSIPSFQPYVAQPSESLKAMPLVSISVNQTVPLIDILFELAKQANFDLELDPGIEGSIIFTAREKPFDQVVKRIAEISGLRYNFDGDVLRVEKDRPYSHTYKVDYLSYIRKNNSSVRNDIAVVTGSGTNTGSAFESSSESEADFWAELETNMTQILGVTVAAGNLRTANTPQISVVDQNPVAPVVPVVVEGGDGEQPIVQVQAPAAVLQVSSLPPVGQESSSGQPDDKDKASFSLNKQAGIVSVFATERQQKEVDEYLREVKRSAMAQVLVEVKILEVSLTDEYNTGINWSEFSVSGKAALSMLLPQGAFLDGTGTAGAGATLAVGGNDVNAVVSALQRFGVVRALASPRMTVLNNQSAVLNVSENLVYFEIDIETTQTDAGITTTLDSEIRNVPEGVLINVLPSVDLDNRSISMAIRPTITNIDSFEFDPAVDLQAAAAGFGPGTLNAVRSSVPIVQVQEFDSVIKMNSGEAVLMGGLMQDRQRTTEQGVPILSEIPMLGSAFKNHVDEVIKTELIVFLKATIVEDNNIHDTDREFYKMFSNDRRPLDL